jgi:FecR protein
MQRIFSRYALLTAVLLMLSFSVQAQYLISSKAGFINRVEGKANLNQVGNSLEAISKASMGSQMNEGDSIVTEADTNVELLLAPGSYLRMSEKTEVRAVRTSLDNTRFDIIRGSAILEVGEIDKKVPLEIGTPRTVVTLNKTGIYRFDVVGNDVAISVRQGEAFIGTREQAISGSAKKIGNNKVYRLIGDTQPETAKLSSKIFDAFDQWSYLRSEQLVAANYSILQRSRSRSSMLSGWIYDPLSNSYTYIPSSMSFVNGYRFGFYRSFYSCDMCYYYPYGGYNNPYYGSGGSVATNIPSRVSDSNRDGDRVQTSRTDVQSRNVEPYSRPSSSNDNSRYSRTSDNSSYSRGGNYDPGSSSSPSSYPSSSPSPSYTPAPSRVEAPSSDRGSTSDGGRGGDTSRTAGSRGNQ